MDGMLTDKGYFIVLKEKFLQWHSKEEVSNKLFNIDAINIRGAIQRFLEHIDSDETAGLSLNSFWHIKLDYLPFHMRYGGMICLKALQSDRPK